jgi:hypothetical protein
LFFEKNLLKVAATGLFASLSAACLLFFFTFLMPQQREHEWYKTRPQYCSLQ